MVEEEVRYEALDRSLPQEAEKLHKQLEASAMERYQPYLRLAGKYERWSRRQWFDQ